MEYNKLHTTDGEDWKKHFKAIADGQMSCSHLLFKLKAKHTKPKDSHELLRVVSETAQIVQQVKSEVRDERREAGRSKPHGVQPIRRSATKHPKRTEAGHFQRVASHYEQSQI